MDSPSPAPSRAPATPTTPHPALDALCAIARFHHIAADPDTLAHQLGLHSGEPLGPTQLLQASKLLGLKAKATRTRLERLALTPLPALAWLSDTPSQPDDPAADAVPQGQGRIVILAQCDGERVLIQDPAAEIGRASCRERV